MKIYKNNINIINKIVYALNTILDNPFYFSLFTLCAVYVLSFAVFTPYYQTVDDLLIKSIADGSYAQTKVPSEFLLFTNIYYGKILKFLYLSFPALNWYDISHYFLLTVSMLVIIACLYKKEGALLYKIVTLLLVILSFTLLFVALQFTLVTVTLATAAVILAIYFITETKLSLVKKLLIIAGFIVFSLISSLIRIEAFGSVIVLGGLFYLSFINKKNYKKAIFFVIIVILTVAATLLLFYQSNRLIKSNAQYADELNYNLARLETTERTIAGTTTMPSKMFVDVENKIPYFANELEKMGWSIGTYRASLNSLHLGDVDLFNVDKYNQFADKFSDQISIKKNFRIKFNIADYYSTFKYYIGVFLILILLFPCQKVYIKGIVLAVIFYLYILGLSTTYKALPPRVWIGFVCLTLFAFFIYIKNVKPLRLEDKFATVFKYFNNFFVRNQLKKLLSVTIYVVLVFLLAAWLYRPLCKFDKVYSKLNKSRIYITKAMNTLDKDKVYMLDIATLEPFAKPFVKNIFDSGFKLLNFTYISQFAVHKDKMSAYNIPQEGTWKYICSNDNVQYLSIQNGAYVNFYQRSNVDAITKFMRDNYGEEIMLIPVQDTMETNLKTFACVKLTPEQIKRKHEILYNMEYSEDE